MMAAAGRYDNWMMGGGPASMQFWFYVTWIAFLVFLILGSIFFWQDIKKNKK